MNKREYLRSLGFEVGTRGRFSAEMLEALKDYPADSSTKQVSDSLDDLLNQPLNDDGTLPGKIVFKINPPRKDGIKFYIAKLTGGQVIKFGTCSQCKEFYSFCHCSNPRPPKWLRPEVAEWTPSEV